MNRLQKKCIIFSVSLHALLIGILLFGSAFLTSEPKSESAVLLKAFDPNRIEAITSGGNPNVTVAPPTHIAPPAPPEQTPVEVPKPVEPPKTKPAEREKVDPIEPEPVKRVKFSDAEPKPRRKEMLSADELKLTRPKPHLSKPVKPREQSDSTAKEYADAKRAQQKFEQSIRNLSKELSTSTAVELLPGPGGGGPLSASYRDIIGSTYYGAWSAPQSLDEDSAQVTIKVTIARDGRVINGRISKPSRNAAMDRSIQNALDTVTFVPLPEGWSDSERTFEVVLTARAKHSI